ncbi:hypothetical protein E1B28_006266 [Marasmius oreades]|uniref:Uncharacterized protein n=1 Tax=Marasmius oreades TaxID=181124 RepID=A0A9P7S4X9_9AGAR|nr:uncharacterized protein E1B28_006266 [Marasmius oreades]KAG7095529.1 hypothetical protein E1B28_006266 [Marasmius oreades]
MTRRRLDLHVSALNDAEYNLYTSSLADITLTDKQDLKGHDDTYYEQLSLSLREARAWLKGRYSHLPSTVIENILRLFSPDLSQTDNLSGGQFFAAQRLVVHAESGKEVDRALAFVQAHPTDRPVARLPSPSQQPLLLTTSRRSTDAVHPTSSNVDNATNNPFTPPPQHPSATNNSFSLGRAKSNPGGPPSVRCHAKAADSIPGNSKLPPLPPRKPGSSAVVPPPRHGSLASTSPSLVTPSMVSSKTVPITSSPHPPVVPPKPTHFTHTTSTLMKQSLQASKTGQTMKKAEEQLERERVLQVLKSSSSSPFSNSTPSRNRSVSPSKPGGLSASSSSTSNPDLDQDYTSSQAPPLPRRRRASPSASFSDSSFQQVALATTSSHSGSNTNPFLRSPFSSSSDHKAQTSAFSSSTLPSSSVSLPSTPNLPPPKHPDQSHRKPPPPVPWSPFTPDGAVIEVIDTRASESNQAHKLPQEDTFISEPLECIPNSVAKSAGPYISVFNSEITPTATPMRKNDRNEESPTARLFRSKSMHHPTSVASPFSPVGDSPGDSPLPPPIRRKRPESVQVLPGNSSPSSASSITSGWMKHSTTNHLKDNPRIDAHRKGPSFNHDESRPHDPLNLRSIAASLSPQLQQIQPKLDKARFKAEAGLSRRGFIINPSMSRRKEDQEGLMSGEDRFSEVGEDGDLRNGQEQGSRYRPRTVGDIGASGWEDNIVHSDSSDDNSENVGLDRHWKAKQSRTATGRRERDVGGAADGSDVGAEKDHLKWPVSEGEGWRRL